MTKRHCYVTDVGDAIEALASALDPERKPPFKGDILDLLEWAEKDVKAMRAEIERLKTVPMKYRRMAFNAQLQNENAQLSQQLADNDLFELDRNKWRNNYRREIAKLTEQLAAKRAEVDALMLEYCPSEMSQEQLDNWAAHQRPAKEQ